VAGTWTGEQVSFRIAGAEQAPDVLGVLDEAAAWLRARGISQWPARFESSWVETAIHRGETWLVDVGDVIAATVTLDWSDPLWSDVGGSAGYLHRMAVRRWASGLGAVILAWATDATRQHGREVLRLDCVAANARLRAYYEAAGFSHRGDLSVGGAPGQRLQDAPPTLVSRYELRLDVPRASTAWR
jgi:hypothetical protein